MTMRYFPSLPYTHAQHGCGRGFSLVEVLVALLVISLGLLGIAGMQAISISNTGVAGFRSVAALQAASMAAAMSANTQYWQADTMNNNTTTVSVNGGTIVSSSDSSLTSSSANCNASTGGGPCTTPSDMAAYDLKQWGQNLSNVLPGGLGSISCNGNNNNGTQIGSMVVSTCTITITWIEKALVQNQIAGVAANAGTVRDYELVVQP